MRSARWSWKNSDDEIIIEQKKKLLFELVLNGIWLGSYHSAESALRDALNGGHFSLPSGLRTCDLAPPRNLAEWAFQPESGLS